MSARILATYLLLFLICGTTYAQKNVSGYVADYRTNEKLPGVIITNPGSKQSAVSDKDGNFSIPAKLNDLLTFSAPGYKTDTILVIDFFKRKVQLSPLGIQLDNVKVTGSPIFDPRKEYPDVYKVGEYLRTPMGRGLIFSPSALFSKKGKEARRLKRFFKTEVIYREVTRLFTRKLVTSMVPLQGQELDNFMTMYRPSLGFLKKASPSDMTLYLNDCYKKFMLLSAEERSRNPLKLD